MTPEQIKYKFLRTLHKAGIIYIRGDRSYNGTNYSTIIDATNKDWIYLGDISNPNEKYPDHRWFLI